MDNKKKPMNLQLKADVAFIDNVLQGEGIQAKNKARRFLLDLAYTLIREDLVKASKLANIRKENVVTAAHVRVAQVSDSESHQPLMLLSTSESDDSDDIQSDDTDEAFSEDEKGSKQVMDDSSSADETTSEEDSQEDVNHSSSQDENGSTDDIVFF